MMIRSLVFTLLTLMAIPAFSQLEKAKVISRAVEGEVRTNENDTLYGTIKVREAQEHYITTIFFTEEGHKKRVLTAYDIKKFKQIVPYPDRPTLGVDEVYFESQPSPDDPYKKVFMPLKEWK